MPDPTKSDTEMRAEVEWLLAEADPATCDHTVVDGDLYGPCRCIVGEQSLKTAGKLIAAWALERDKAAQRAEGEIARVEAGVKSWGNGRTTSGVDRMIPASEVLALLADPVAEAGDQRG